MKSILKEGQLQNPRQDVEQNIIQAKVNILHQLSDKWSLFYLRILFLRGRMAGLISAEAA